MTHPYHQPSVILQRLQEGFLPLLAPVPTHLAARVVVEYSADFFATSRDVILVAERDGFSFGGEIPVEPGKTVQYRFRGELLSSGKVFYLNRPEGNCSFFLPPSFSCRPCPNLVDEVYPVLDSGRVALLRDTELQLQDTVLVNLLGEHPFQDALDRGDGLLRAADLTLLLPADRRDAFLAAGKVGSRGEPREFLNERLIDPGLQGMTHFRYQELGDSAPLLPVLQQFDQTYWFPVLGMLPLHCPGGIAPALTVDFLAVFFASWLDVLFIDGLMIER